MRLTKSRWLVALVAFTAGGIASPILEKIGLAIYLTIFPDQEYSVLIDSCAPLKSARLLLRNIDTNKLIADKKIEWMNETTVIVKNIGKKVIQKPVISINALPFGSENIQPLFATIYSSSVESAHKAQVTRIDSFFRIELEQMNPDDYIWLEANFSTPISFLVELYGIGITRAEARSPGCKSDTKYRLSSPPAQAFSYIGKSCEKKDTGVSCKIQTAEIPFNVPNDAAPGARIAEQYLIDKD